MLRNKIILELNNLFKPLLADFFMEIKEFGPIDVEGVTRRLTDIIHPRYELEPGKVRIISDENWNNPFVNPFIDPDEERNLYDASARFVQTFTVPKPFFGLLNLGDDRNLAELYVEEGAVDPDESSGHLYRRIAFVAKDDIDLRDGRNLSKGSTINFLIQKGPLLDGTDVDRKDFVPKRFWWGYSPGDFSELVPTDVFVDPKYCRAS